MVSEWADLQIEVKGEVKSRKPLRRVASYIALCLVEGSMSEVEISIPQEAMHYELAGDPTAHGSSIALGRAALARSHSFTVQGG